MVARSDLSTLHLTDLKYRAPWDLLGADFQRGPIVVAGDAMHAMGPFLAQGGSAALEDAIVLGRCLFLTDPPRHPTGVRSSQPSSSRRRSAMDIEEALSEFVALRRRRVVRLSAQTYLTGLLVQNSSLVIVKFAIGVVIAILFGDGTEHTSYDCGSLTIDKDYAS